MPTNGITRTQSNVTQFDDVTEAMKFTAQGGRDAWPRDKYLNLWVVRRVVDSLNRPLLGYAQFPGGPAATDGVVILFSAFGNTGTVAAPYNRGRTATHEIGHWLNLFHTFEGGCAGTTAATCAAAGDLVCDTPGAAAPTFNCPSTQNTCTDSPTNNPDQTMNYMDYVDDACMFMFTLNQSVRMDATLYGPRAALVGSDGLLLPPSSSAPDPWSQDMPDDVGDEPNTISSTMWQSDDIWVRNQNDGVTNQEHQNPEFRTSGSPTSFVYVRIRNAGCSPAPPATVKLYWAKASTGLSWPSPWDGTVTTPAQMGNPIGTQTTTTIPGGGFTILAFPWSPPNPAAYAAFGADRSHFCLLSRIETSSTAPFGMASPETSDLNENVRNNDNIVWKNVEVVDDLPGSGREAGRVTVANFGNQATTMRLAFNGPRNGQQESVFQMGTVTIDLGDRLYEKWRRGGAQGNGVQRPGKKIVLRQDGASIQNIRLEPNDLHTIKFQFKPALRVRGSHVFGLDVVQYASDGTGETLVGGQHFTVKTVYSRKKRCWLIEFLSSIFH
jgi:hypothetical protein